MIYNIFYGKDYQNAVFVECCHSESDAWKCISKYVKDMNFTSYHYNCYKLPIDNNVTRVDYGSWNRFFYIFEKDESRKEVSEC